jgi:hypothetical protein
MSVPVNNPIDNVEDLEKNLKNLFQLLTIYEVQNSIRNKLFSDYKLTLEQLLAKINTISVEDINTYNEIVNSLNELPDFMSFVSNYKPTENQTNSKPDSFFSGSKKLFILTVLKLVIIISILGTSFFLIKTKYYTTSMVSVVENKNLTLDDSKVSSFAMQSVPDSKLHKVDVVDGVFKISGAPTSFLTEKTLVSINEFSKFVESTGYQTDAEKEGWSYIYNSSTNKFELQYYINWRFDGFGKKLSTDNLDAPVVHVSYNDALAYSKWDNKRLPALDEWKSMVNYIFKVSNIDPILLSEANKDSLLHYFKEKQQQNGSLQDIIGINNQWSTEKSQQTESNSVFLCGSLLFLDKATLLNSLIRTSDKNYRDGNTGFRCVSDIN